VLRPHNGLLPFSSSSLSLLFITQPSHIRRIYHNKQQNDNVSSTRLQKQTARLLWRPRASTSSFPSCIVCPALIPFPYSARCVAFSFSQQSNFEGQSANKLFFSSNPFAPDVPNKTTAEFGTGPTGENREMELPAYQQAVQYVLPMSCLFVLPFVSRLPSIQRSIC
jgi:hypothetical protein